MTQHDIQSLVILCLMVILILMKLIVKLIRLALKRKDRIGKLEERNDTLVKKNRKIRQETSKEFKDRLTTLSQLIDEKQKLIQQMERDNRISQEERKGKEQEIADLTEGCKWLFYILNNEEHLTPDKAECHRFICCYQYIDETFTAELNDTSVNSISETEKMFCILHRLDKTPQQICDIMGWSPDSYRQVKSRTVRKLRQRDSLLFFCDKIALSNNPKNA